MNQWRYFVLILAVFIITGCASKVQKPEVQAIPRTPPPLFHDKAKLITVPKDKIIGTPPHTTKDEEESDIPQQRLIYFDYDKSEIKTVARTILNKHASYLSENPTVQVRLEGHADERGSHEYNLALGEQRAEVAKNWLITKGVLENRLSTLSYGEERPATQGHDEQSWQQNRRVELIYLE